MQRNILAEILAHKEEETAQRMRGVALAEIRRRAADTPPPKAFAAALQDVNNRPVIAEIKYRSPSKGVLCEPFAPAEIAYAYKAGKAACLSVLTDDKFFGGATEHLQAAVAASNLPVLRKDFILNEWQVFESRAMGADAVLLIVAALPEENLQALAAVAHGLGMAVLVESHSAQELAVALTVTGALIGINNRNLQTFHTDIQTTVDLLPQIRQDGKDCIVISESGIHERSDIERLSAVGVNAFLIGESLVRNPSATLDSLFAA